MSNVVTFPGVETQEKKVDAKELVRQQANNWAIQAQGIQIVDDETYRAAVVLGQAGATIEAQIKDTFKPLKADADALHKKLCATEKGFLTPVQQGLERLRSIVRAWKEQQDRLAAQRQKEAEEAARKLAEDAKLALAVQAADSGASEAEIESILDANLTMPAPVLPAAPKVEGLREGGRWKAQVIDIKALCRAVADGKVMAELVEPNMPLLNKLAVQYKEAFNVPGCTAKKESNVGFSKVQ